MGSSETCPHPFGSLKINAGNSGQRGTAESYRVECRDCRRSWPGAAGLGLLVERDQANSEDLWQRLKVIGGPRFYNEARGGASASPSHHTRSAGLCPHFLNWLKIESAGGQRGQAERLLVRCGGCKTSWTMAAGLVIYFARAHESRCLLEAAVKQLERNLGHGVQPQEPDRNDQRPDQADGVCDVRCDAGQEGAEGGGPSDAGESVGEEQPGCDGVADSEPVQDGESGEGGEHGEHGRGEESDDSGSGSEPLHELGLELDASHEDA